MAQIVSLKTLKALAKKPIAEAEGSSRFWHEASRQHSQLLRHLMRSQHLDERSALKEAYLQMKNGFLREHCPPIEYISAGSSRAAFALDGGQCLKIAKNPSGVGQNKAELENMDLAGDLDIFPRLYDWSDDCTMLLVECITPAKESDDRKIAQLLGVKTCPVQFSVVDQISQIIKFIVEDIQLQPEESIEVIYEDSDEKVWREIAGYVLKPTTIQQKLLRALVLYAIKHYRELDPSDIAFEENWGFAVRDGQICPIMLDAGFSEYVKDTWY